MCRKVVHKDASCGIGWRPKLGWRLFPDDNQNGNDTEK